MAATMGVRVRTARETGSKRAQMRVDSGENKDAIEQHFPRINWKNSKGLLQERTILTSLQGNFFLDIFRKIYKIIGP